MKNSIDNIIKPAFMITFLLLSGCAGLRPELTVVNPEIEHDEKISQVHVYRDGAQTRISGKIRKFKRQRVSHVRITVITDDGKALSQETFPHPLRVKTKWYFFSQQLPVDADSVRKVNILSHSVLEHESTSLQRDM